MLGRLSLRARLVLGVIAIAAVGLVAADVATYRALSSFLLDRVDSTLDAVHPGVEAALFPPQGPEPRPGGDLRALFDSIPGDCIEVRRTNQAVLAATCIPRVRQTRRRRPAPKLPATVTLPTSANTPGRRPGQPSSPSRR